MIIIQLSTVTEFNVERATRMVIIFKKKYSLDKIRISGCLSNLTIPLKNDWAWEKDFIVL